MEPCGNPWVIFIQVDDAILFEPGVVILTLLYLFWRYDSTRNNFLALPFIP